MFFAQHAVFSRFGKPFCGKSGSLPIILFNFVDKTKQFIEVSTSIMNLPEDFLLEINSYNAPVLEGLADALQSQPVISIRANRHKNFVPGRDSLRPVKWCAGGYYLENRLPFTFDPAMHQGLYYVQDASSMILSHVVSRLSEGGNALKYLDACAAPGGKTTAAIDALPPGSLVVANEYVPTRAAVLCENLTKWGYPAIVATKGDTARYRKLPEFFDIIGADVPCSGEGMFRKDQEAVAQWSQALVRECVARQREIVDNLWSTLRPGGYMIYSTCTFNRHENEEMVDYMVKTYGAEPIDMRFPQEWNIPTGINTDYQCYRFLPHVTEGEGLFVAVLRKPGEVQPNNEKKNKTKDKAKKNAVPETVPSWLRSDSGLELSLDKDEIIAYPQAWQSDLSQLRSKTDVVMAGVAVATMKGRDAIPRQSLALSSVLNRDAFICHEVDYMTAIAFLRREAIVLPDAVGRGYVLLTYRNHPLGFVKNLGNRANNLYPAEWRILSSHIPDAPPMI